MRKIYCDFCKEQIHKKEEVDINTMNLYKAGELGKCESYDDYDICDSCFVKVKEALLNLMSKGD